MDSIDPHGIKALASLVRQIVDESGDPTGFDELAWIEQWLQEPLGALGSARPADYMGTPEGKLLVETLIRRMQSGAHS